MPHCYFDVRNGRGQTDSLGMECRDDNGAIAKSKFIATQIAIDTFGTWDFVLSQHFVGSYPIIFNYRQSLELRLKYLLMAYGPLTDEAPDYRSHDLEKLWAKCKRVIVTLDGAAQPSDKEAFEAVDKLIAEFDAVDPGSVTFRFAHDTKGKSIKLGISAIDLLNLRGVVAGLHNFLECVDLHLHHGRGVPHCQH
jgi:hypothetical protein